MQHVINTLRAFVEVLLPIAVVVATGYLLRRAFPLDQRTLNRVSIYGLSPCLMFVTLLRTDIVRSTALRLTAHMLVVMLAMCGIAWLVAMLLRLTRHQRAGFMLATTFMNSGNYGLSASRFAWGETGFQFAVIGYLVQTILSQTFGVYLASAGRNNRRNAAMQVLRMPIVYAVVVALGFRLLGIHLDETNGALAVGVYRGLRLLADATLPLLLLILGMQLHQRQPVESFGPLTAALTIRLVAVVPLAYGAGVLLGLDGLALRVGILQCAMPTAVNMTIVAAEFNAWPQFVNNVVIASTMASLVTLTVLLAMLR